MLRTFFCNLVWISAFWRSHLATLGTALIPHLLGNELLKYALTCLHCFFIVFFFSTFPLFFAVIKRNPALSLRDIFLISALSVRGRSGCLSFNIRWRWRESVLFYGRTFYSIFELCTRRKKVFKWHYDWQPDSQAHENKSLFLICILTSLKRTMGTDPFNF